VTAIDGWLEGFIHEPASLGMVLLVSLPLGLGLAMDPDHLAAVTTLIASEKEHGVREPGLMRLLCGLGYGSTLVLLGLPLMLLGHYLPEIVAHSAEAAIGCIIVLLAVRLFVRWRRASSAPTTTATAA
jgi:hypothetical protein